MSEAAGILENSIDSKPKADNSTAESADVSREKRIRELDGLRGIAILLVLIHHFGEIPADLQNGLIGGLWSNFVYGSWIGVDLFFVLSGFLITGILLRSKGRPHYFSNFYARRSLRIFPLYFGLLLAVFVVCPLILGQWRPVEEQAWLWLYGSSVSPWFHGDIYPAVSAYGLHFEHFWSLAIEEHFYLVWPAIVLFCTLRRLRNVCIMTMMASLTIRLVIVLQASKTEDWHWMGIHCYSTDGSRLDGLAMGSLIAVLTHTHKSWPALRLWTMAAFWITGVTLFARLCHDGLKLGLKPNALLSYTFTSGFFGSVLVLLLNAKPGNIFRRVARSSVLRAFGQYSYGIYIWHGLFQGFFALLMPARWLAGAIGNPILATWVHLLASILMAFGMGFISWHLVEKHFIRIKERFREQRSTVKPAHALVPLTIGAGGKDLFLHSETGASR